MLVDQGRADELRTLSDAGDPTATLHLTMSLRGQDKLDESEAVLRSSVDAGNKTVAIRLAQSLVIRNKLGELRAMATAGNTVAARSTSPKSSSRISSRPTRRLAAETGDRPRAGRIVGRQRRVQRGVSGAASFGRDRQPPRRLILK